MKETSQSEPPKKTSPTSEFILNKAEWFLFQMDVIRFWFTRAWRIGILMAKGGYLTSEKKKLFNRLGEEAFYRMQKGDLSLTELIPLTQKIQNLIQKIEIQELLIRRLRFGTSHKKKITSQGSEEPTIMT